MRKSPFANFRCIQCPRFDRRKRFRTIGLLFQLFPCLQTRMSAPQTTEAVSTSAGTRSEPITARVIKVFLPRLRASYARLMQGQFHFRLRPARQPARLQGGRLQARGHCRPGRADQPALSRLLSGQEGERKFTHLRRCFLPH